MIIDATEGMEVVGEVDNGEDAVAKAVELRPDVCLFDVRMAHLDGVEATRQVVERCGPEGPRVVIITTFDLDEYVYGALDAGATGFLLKNSGPELLVEAIRAAAVDESLISPAVTTRLLRHLGRSTTQALGHGDDLQLSDREEEVLRAVAIGSTNTEIAAELHLSVSTVKAHVASLLTKIDARNRVELAMWAYRTGRID
ncbi:MAG: response regulator transcription factor, partial [Actinomycetota bacterium]